MSKIKVEFRGVFREITKRSSTEVDFKEGATICDVLSDLKRRYGKEFAETITLEHYMIIRINGTDCRKLEDLNTPVNTGDRLSISHLVAGG